MEQLQPYVCTDSYEIANRIADEASVEGRLGTSTGISLRSVWHSQRHGRRLNTVLLMVRRDSNCWCNISCEWLLHDRTLRITQVSLYASAIRINQKEDRLEWKLYSLKLLLARYHELQEACFYFWRVFAHTVASDVTLHLPKRPTRTAFVFNGSQYTFSKTAFHAQPKRTLPWQ